MKFVFILALYRSYINEIENRGEIEIVNAQVIECLMFLQVTNMFS